MSVVRVNFLPEFYLGDDAVLLTLDGGGVDKMIAAVEEARNNRSSRFLHNGVEQAFHIELGAATVDLSPTRVVWRLDQAKAAEISEDLVALRDPNGSGTTDGHVYVDMTSPAETLVISRDEYTDVVYPWVSPDPLSEDAVCSGPDDGRLQVEAGRFAEQSGPTPQREEPRE